jgi:hypothetical protein
MDSILSQANRLQNFEQVFPVISTSAAVVQSNPVASMFDPVATLRAQQSLLQAFGTSVSKAGDTLEASTALAAAQGVAASSDSLAYNDRVFILSNISQQVRRQAVISSASAQATITAVSSLSTAAGDKTMPMRNSQLAVMVVNSVGNLVMQGRLEGETVNLSSPMLDLTTSRTSKKSANMAFTASASPSSASVKLPPGLFDRLKTPLARRNVGVNGPLDVQIVQYNYNPYSESSTFSNREVASSVVSLRFMGTGSFSGALSIEEMDASNAPIITLPMLDGVMPLGKNTHLKCYVWDTSSSDHAWMWQRKYAQEPSSTAPCTSTQCACQVTFLSAQRYTFVIFKETVDASPSVPIQKEKQNDFSEWWAFVTAFFVVILIAAVFCCLWRHAGHTQRNAEVELQPQGVTTQPQLSAQELLANQQELKQRISRLFSFVYVEGSLSKDDALCSVCLDCFEGGGTLRMLPCLHRFHKDCIDEWLQRKPFCPLCKANPFRMQQPPRRVMRALAALPEPQMAAARGNMGVDSPREGGEEAIEVQVPVPYLAGKTTVHANMVLHVESLVYFTELV